jgi:hypothetical protein
MRKLGLVALVALLTLTGVSAASAKSKVEAFASKHHLKGTWKSKDADKDGLKNFKEFKLGTDPRKADSDKDGLNDGHELESGNHPLKADTDGDKVKDGKEHAGVVTAFDGETLTFREFATGKKVTATLDTECTPALTEDEDVPADDSGFDDGSADDLEEGEFFQEEDDLGGGDDEGCDDDDALEQGVVLQSAELDEEGFLVEYVLA